MTSHSIKTLKYNELESSSQDQTNTKPFDSPD